MKRFATLLALVLLMFTLYFVMLGSNALAFLSPKNINWVIRGDTAYQFFSLNSFFANNWTWPLGSFQGYLYESPINLFLADAIPWWGILLKILIGKTRDLQQYNGLWFLLCCILQVHASYSLSKLVYRETLSKWAVTIALCFAAFLIQRIGHPGLCAQFLILYSFGIALKSREYSLSRSVISALSLSFVASGLHPYFVPMISLTFASIPFISSPNSPFKKNLGRSIGVFLASILMSGLMFYILGAKSNPLNEIKPVNFYTGDVLIFFNSMNVAYFPQLWAPRMGQYEGYAYLGLGWLFLLVLGIFFVFKRRLKILQVAKASRFGPLMATSICLGVWSWGENIRIFGQWIISLHYLYFPFYPLIGSFRAAGRFAWPLAYLLILLLPLIIQSYGPKFARTKIFLVVILLFQLLDGSRMWFPTIESKPSFQTLDTRSIKELMTSQIHSLDLMPPDLVNTECRNKLLSDSDFMPLARAAHELALSFNSGNRANPPAAPADIYCQKAALLFASGDWQADRLYVFDLKSTVVNQDRLQCRELGRWRFCSLIL